MVSAQRACGVIRIQSAASSPYRSSRLTNGVASRRRGMTGKIAETLLVAHPVRETAPARTG
jgi:hypothetical protein